MAKSNFFKLELGKKKSKGNGEVAAPEEFDASAPFVPGPPVTNVLPKELKESYATSKLIGKFVKAGVVTALFFVIMYLASFILNGFHQAELQALDEEAASLTQQSSSLRPYSTYQSAIEEKRKLLAGQLDKDVDVQRILGDLNDIGDANGIIFGQIALTITNGEEGDSCVQPDPFNAVPTIGCLTITGSSTGRESTNAFFTTVEGTEGFENAFIAGVTNEVGGRSTFNGSVSITNHFYSDRYGSLSAPLADALAGVQGEQPVEEAPSEEVTEEEAPEEETTEVALATLLTGQFPDVFADLGEEAANTSASQLCSALEAGGMDLELLTAGITSMSSNPEALTPALVQEIATIMVQNSCEENLPNLDTLLSENA